MDNIKRVKIPDGYYWMDEFEKCPYCKEEGHVYGQCDENEDGNLKGEFMCIKCECTWSKV